MAAGCSPAGNDRTQANSSLREIVGQMSWVGAPTISVSRPMAGMLARGAPAAAQKPVVWVMLPMNPAGHSGCRSGAARSANSRTPNSARAARAHARPAANSVMRFGTALATSSASAGCSSAGSPGMRRSLMTTVGGNRVRIGPSGTGGGFNGNCEVVDTLTIISRDHRVQHYASLTGTWASLTGTWASLTGTWAPLTRNPAFLELSKEVEPAGACL